VLTSLVTIVLNIIVYFYCLLLLCYQDDDDWTSMNWELSRDVDSDNLWLTEKIWVDDV
jgi:hypothetical protein